MGKEIHVFYALRSQSRSINKYHTVHYILTRYSENKGECAFVQVKEKNAPGLSTFKCKIHFWIRVNNNQKGLNKKGRSMCFFLFEAFQETFYCKEVMPNIVFHICMGFHNAVGIGVVVVVIGKA